MNSYVIAFLIAVAVISYPISLIKAYKFLTSRKKEKDNK